MFSFKSRFRASTGRWEHESLGSRNGRWAEECKGAKSIDWYYRTNCQTMTTKKWEVGKLQSSCSCENENTQMLTVTYPCSGYMHSSGQFHAANCLPLVFSIHFGVSSSQRCQIRITNTPTKLCSILRSRSFFPVCGLKLNGTLGFLLILHLKMLSND